MLPSMLPGIHAAAKIGGSHMALNTVCTKIILYLQLQVPTSCVTLIYLQVFCFKEAPLHALQLMCACATTELL